MFKDFIGKMVENIETDSTSAKFTFSDGTVKTLMLEGDCCSSSYFSDRTQFNELLGTTIWEMEDRYNRTDDHDYTVTKWSFLVIKTNESDVTIDWRNDSNGYYSGWIYVE